MALVDSLAAGDSAGTPLRAGTVLALNGVQVDVDINGSTMTLPRLSWYTPTVGDSVLILPSEIGWIVLGKVAV